MSVKANKKELSQIVNLMKASTHNQREIKKLLRECHKNGFNFNSKYYQGKTLIHLAIEYNYNSLIKTLVMYGCNPNICDDKYISPLHFSVIKQDIKALKTLLKCNVDINIAGEFDQTPLHLAMISGNLKIAKILINNNADLTVVDERNLSIIDYAKDEKNNKIIEYLERKFKIKKGERQC